MQLKKLTVEDRDLFLQYYKKNPAKCSYLSFANLFVWKDAEDIEYFQFENLLIVTGKSIYDGKRYFMLPLGDCICGEVKKLLDDKFGTDYHIYGITGEDFHRINRHCADEFDLIRQRDMDNYVYTSEKLISLSGKKLHAKRNHINKFKDLYSYSYERLNENNRKELDIFIEEWYAKKEDSAEESLMLERTALENALKNLNKLELKCGMLKVDGKIVAFSIGEQLNEDTALIHFEKADTDYQGAYPMINNEFVKNEWSHLRYINREDDMGLEGLRKAKLSYQPDIMVEMYAAKPKAKL